MVATSGEDFGAEFLKSRTAKFYPTWSSARFQVSARLQCCTCKDFTRVRRAGTKTARHYRSAYSLTGAKKRNRADATHARFYHEAIFSRFLVTATNPPSDLALRS